MRLAPLFLLLTTLLTGMSCADAIEPMQWNASMLKQDSEWYDSAEARAAADTVVSYQSQYGGWPKNWDLLSRISAEEMETLQNGGKANTIDNDGTTLPMEFLAMVAHASGDAKYAGSFIRGLDYLLAAQYDTGGWPQYYPLREGYYRRITFNDNAMMNVMFLLRDVAASKAPYSFVDEARVANAARAIERGLTCILATQVRQNGKLTGWAAQYDEKALTPAWARTYEPPSLSGAETIAVVQYLMEIEHPTHEHVAAIQGAVAWLEAVAIYGFRYERVRDADGQRDAVFVADPNAARLWARFYEFISNRPIFLGRDSVVRYSMDEIEQERRGIYRYYGDWAEDLLTRDYPRWQATHAAITGDEG